MFRVETVVRTLNLEDGVEGSTRDVEFCSFAGMTKLKAGISKMAAEICAEEAEKAAK